MSKKAKIIIIIVSSILVAAAIIFFAFPVTVVLKGDAELSFVYNDKDIHEKLTDEQADAVREIFNGKILLFDSPSCGFDKDISISFGTQTFSIASDTCGTVEFNGRYFDVSDEDIEYLHSLFEEYGGAFPCV